MINFRKMHGAGNDFVIIDNRIDDIESITLTQENVRYICDRNFGVGCDLLVVLEISNKADVFARFYNADGSGSDACGNATRCVAGIIMQETGAGECTIETGGGILPCTLTQKGSNLVTVDMGAPRAVKDIPLDGTPVSVELSNPHCVFFVDDVASIDLKAKGAPVENNADMFPNRTNVEFVQVIGENKLRQRTWERGVGETLACGSGACAVAIAAVTRGLSGRKVEIQLDGGTLFMEYRKSDNRVLMTGPYEYVFEGKLNAGL